MPPDVGGGGRVGKGKPRGPGGLSRGRKGERERRLFTKGVNDGNETITKNRELLKHGSGFPSHSGERPVASPWPHRGPQALRGPVPASCLPCTCLHAALCPFLSSQAGPLSDPRQQRPVPSSGPLHSLFSLPGMPIPQLFPVSPAFLQCLLCTKDNYK